MEIVPMLCLCYGDRRNSFSIDEGNAVQVYSPSNTHSIYIYIITNTIINNAEEALAMDLILLSPRAWPSIAFAVAEVLIETEVEPQKLIR